jgi:outer membrane protein assembly factor BamB
VVPTPIKSSPTKPPRPSAPRRTKGLKWRIDLPETGQSSPILVDGKIFLTCFEPVTENTGEATHLLALCLNQKYGDLLWQRKLPGDLPSRISGCFSDNSSPAPVSDGNTICFFNASGPINNYDFDGNLRWSARVRHSIRSDPFLLDGTLMVNGAAESHTVIDRHLRGFDFKTGELLWESPVFSWESSTSIPYQMEGGSWVALVGRGGGHARGDFKTGVSLISLESGEELWSYPIPHFNATQNFPLKNGRAHVFLRNGGHLVLDLKTGAKVRQDNLLEDVKVDFYKSNAYTYGPFEKNPNYSKKTIVQMSNFMVGDYHYFRTYVGSFLGRVHIKTGKTEYLHLPGKIDRSKSETVLGWGKRLPNNAMINNSGYRVCGDERSVNNGWGHHVTALPTVCGDTLYVPTMCGLVYVLKWNADRLDHHALVSISDLGKLGDTWNRSSLTSSEGLLYARTIKELLCISGCTPDELPDVTP